VVKAARRAPPRRTYVLTLTGELDGYHVTMGAMTGREIIALQRGVMDEADVLEMVTTRCVEHDFDIPDLRDLDYWIIAELLDAWATAMTAVAIPPTNGTS
jgi:hypothetical protein